MEGNKILEAQTQGNDKEYTYVFDVEEEMHAKISTVIKVRIWQIFPSVCGSIICLPFGLMLAWPSPSYPKLLAEDSPIFITLDQSAMIAGFLMIGNIMATPFSTYDRFEAKYGLLFGSALMVAGWLIIWRATDIYYLLGGRLLAGIANGLTVGQLKTYIRGICEERLCEILIKQIHLYVFFGVVLACAIGPFVAFRQLGIICAIISVFVLFLAIFLPSTPHELVRKGKLDDAKKLLAFLSPNCNVITEIDRIKDVINTPNSEMSFCDIQKDQVLRRNFFIFACLIFCQQCSGAPATIIYSQILFSKSNCPYPEFCALAYSIVFFLSNIFGIYCSPKFNKKRILLFSSIGVSVILLLQIFVIYYQIHNFFWNYTSLVVMIVYIIFHTIGLGNVPFTLMSIFFPPNSFKVIAKFFVMFHSLLALIITKIFQVLFTNNDFYIPFCLFLCISLVTILFIIIFLPKDENENKMTRGMEKNRSLSLDK